MALFSMRERRIAESIAAIGFGNPFVPERITLERRALGGDFVESGPVVRVQSDASYDTMFPNVANLHRLAETLVEAARRRLGSGHDATEVDLALYEDLVCYVLYNRHLSLVQQSVRTSLGLSDWRGPVERWPAFLADFRAFLELPDRTLPPDLGGASVRGLLPGRTGVPLDLRKHSRRLVADSSVTRGGLAINFYA